MRRPSAFFLPCLSHPGLRWVVWLLLFSVPMYGTAGVLLGVLGPAHRHSAPSQATPQAGLTAASGLPLEAWLQQQVRALVGDLAAAELARAHLHAERQHDARQHHHGLFEHHHHAANDASVELIGDSDGSAQALGEAAAAGGASLPFGPLATPTLRLHQPAAQAWPPAPPQRWVDTAPAPLDRPPSA